MIRTLLCIVALGLPAGAQAPSPQAAPQPVPSPTAAPATKPRVQLLTSYGPIVVELEPGLAPLDTLVEKPTRDPILNEVGSTFKAGLKNARGTIAMARTANPHSASSQFYINLVDNPSLDPHGFSEEGFGYCAFGRVVSGMEAVDKIAKVRTEWRRGMGDIPQFPVYLKDVVLLPPQ